MLPVIVYSKSQCMYCQFTKKYLQEQKIPYEEKNVETDLQAFSEIEPLGFTSLPIVVSEVVPPFCGFRPDKLSLLL